MHEAKIVAIGVVVAARSALKCHWPARWMVKLAIQLDYEAREALKRALPLHCRKTLACNESDKLRNELLKSRKFSHELVIKSHARLWRSFSVGPLRWAAAQHLRANLRATLARASVWFAAS